MRLKLCHIYRCASVSLDCIYISVGLSVSVAVSAVQTKPQHSLPTFQQNNHNKQPTCLSQALTLKYSHSHYSLMHSYTQKATHVNGHTRASQFRMLTT